MRNRLIHLIFLKITIFSYHHNIIRYTIQKIKTHIRYRNICNRYQVIYKWTPWAKENRYLYMGIITQLRTQNFPKN